MHTAVNTIGIILTLIALWAYIGGALGLYGWSAGDTKCHYNFFSVGESRSECNGSMNDAKYEERAQDRMW